MKKLSLNKKVALPILPLYFFIVCWFKDPATQTRLPWSYSWKFSYITSLSIGFLSHLLTLYVFFFLKCEMLSPCEQHILQLNKERTWRQKQCLRKGGKTVGTYQGRFHVGESRPRSSCAEGRGHKDLTFGPVTDWGRGNPRRWPGVGRFPGYRKFGVETANLDTRIELRRPTNRRQTATKNGAH